MKGILKSITTALRGDSNLQTLVSYSSSDKNIRMETTLKSFNYDKGVVYGRVTLDRRLLKDTNAIREGYFYVAALDRESATNCMDIAERIIDVLDDLSISETDVKGYACLWDGFQTSVYYDEEFKYYRVDLRFKIIIREI